MPENQLRLLFEDYLHDLASFPAHIIAQACAEYRLDPEHRFFPSSGWLVVKAKALSYPLRHRLGIIEKILNAKPPEKREAVAAEEWAKLKSSLGAELREAGREEKTEATITAMRAAGAPESDIEAFTKGQAA